MYEPPTIPKRLLAFSTSYKTTELGLVYMGSFNFDTQEIFSGPEVTLRLIVDEQPSLELFKKGLQSTYEWVETPEKLWTLLAQWGYPPAVSMLREMKIDFLLE